MSSTSVGGFKRRQGKTKASQRAIRKTEAKVFENPKSILFLRGANTSDVVTDAMNDLCHIMKPHFKKLKKRNAFHAFEGLNHIEFLGFKNDCSLFCMGSDSKKRPHNLVLGRQFEFKVLDVVELGILAMDPLTPENVKGSGVASIGSKPFFVFEGGEFDSEPFFIRLKNFLLDYFKGSTDPEINLDGVDRCIMVSLRSNTGSDAVVAPSDDCLGTKPQIIKGNTVVCFRHYAVSKTTSQVGIAKSADRVQLTDIGPNFDFEVRRVYFAPPAEFKNACKMPREAIAHLKGMHENVAADALGNLKGQLHLGKQDITKLNLRRFSAYRKGRVATTLEGDKDNTDEQQQQQPVIKKSRLERDDNEEHQRSSRKRNRKSAADALLGELGPDTDI